MTFSPLMQEAGGIARLGSHPQARRRAPPRWFFQLPFQVHEVTGAYLKCAVNEAAESNSAVTAEKGVDGSVIPVKTECSSYEDWRGGTCSLPVTTKVLNPTSEEGVDYNHFCFYGCQPYTFAVGDPCVTLDRREAGKAKTKDGEPDDQGLAPEEESDGTVDIDATNGMPRLEPGLPAGAVQSGALSVAGAQPLAPLAPGAMGAGVAAGALGTAGTMQVGGVWAPAPAPAPASGAALPPGALSPGTMLPMGATPDAAHGGMPLGGPGGVMGGPGAAAQQAPNAMSGMHNALGSAVGASGVPQTPGELQAQEMQQAAGGAAPAPALAGVSTTATTTTTTKSAKKQPPCSGKYGMPPFPKNYLEKARARRMARDMALKRLRRGR